MHIYTEPPSPPLSPMQNSTLNQCDSNGAWATVEWDCPMDTAGTTVTNFAVFLDGEEAAVLNNGAGTSVAFRLPMLNVDYTATMTASNCNGTSDDSEAFIVSINDNGEYINHFV